jgi:hypothetical protein
VERSITLKCSGKISVEITPMSDQYPSSPIKIDLGPTFGSDIDRIRNGQISWLSEIEGGDGLIFSLEIPLELVGSVSDAKSTSNPMESLTSLKFVPRGDVKVQGTQPDSHIREILCAGGGMNMSVDSLSRSILLTDVDERTFIDKLQERPDTTAEGLDVLRRKLLVPALFNALDDTTATQATTQLKENIQHHEREHVRCLIDPETALWRELELYWCSVLICTKSLTWHHSDVLNRLVALCGTPSRFTAELLAMLNEPYPMDNPAIERAVSTDITAQRGTGGALLQFLDEHNINTGKFTAILRSPEGEQYCDLWLAYVIDHLRSGGTLEDIDPTDFHDRLDMAATPYGDAIADPDFRTQFVDFIRTRSRGPVFEQVRLKFVDDEFVLERAWYSLNDRTSGTEHLVAVRRVLFRRLFFSQFTDSSGLDTIRTKREAAVEDIIHGESFDEMSLFEISSPDPAELRDQLISTYETVAPAFLGPQATADDLQQWLTDPEYGYFRLY